jgi:hypothetical protein
MQFAASGVPLNLCGFNIIRHCATQCDIALQFRNRQVASSRAGAGSGAEFAVIYCISVHPVAADENVRPQDFSVLQAGAF